jgi:aminopeptidase N
MRTEEPRAVRLQDYRAPDYRVEKLSLDFKLEPDATRVASKMEIVRRAKDASPLVLNG